MTPDPSDVPTDDARRTDADDRSSLQPTAGLAATASRRDVLKAAGAGVGALAFGGAAAGTTAAQSDRGIATPWLDVQGNRILDPNGNEVTLRGLNMADPKRIDVTAPARGKTALQVIDEITDPDDGWHPRVIRVPVQPIDIGEHEPGHTGGPPEPPAFDESQLLDYLENHLDPVVDYLEELGFYCIVDFHRHWQGLRWDEPALSEEVQTFWSVVAPRYADRSHVIFEVYNEPTEPGIWGDQVSDDYWAGMWDDYKAVVQPWVDTIREHAPENLVIIGSPSWTQNPEGYYANPFDGENLGYTYHIYPGHSVSQNQGWDGVGTDGSGVQSVYEDVPLFVTEFGWQNDIKDRYLQGTTSGFGDPFLSFLESHDSIHWTAWCADPIWLPAMYDRPFTNEEETDSIGHPYEDEIPEYCPDLPCEWDLLGAAEGTYDDYSGQRIKDELAARRDHGVPSSGLDAPSNLRVTGTTTSSVDVAWDASEDAVDHYAVSVDGDQNHTVAAGTTSTTVGDLRHDATYAVGVTAVAADGTESRTVTVAATTERDPEAAPAPPSNLVVSDATQSSVSLDWDASGSDVSQYDVSVDGTFDHSVAGDVTASTVSDLQADTTYDVAVTAVDGEGDESDPATVTATTDPADAGPSVDQFDVADRSSGPWSKVRVSWAVSDAEGALASLDVALVDGSGATADAATQSISGSSASGKHDLRERNGGGEYTVELTVADQAGTETTVSETVTL